MPDDRETLFIRVARRMQRFQWPVGMPRPARLLIVWAIGLPIVMLAGWAIPLGVHAGPNGGNGGPGGAFTGALGFTILCIWQRNILTN